MFPNKMKFKMLQLYILFEAKIIKSEHWIIRENEREKMFSGIQIKNSAIACKTKTCKVNKRKETFDIQNSCMEIKSDKHYAS